jgi:hypothetical protein
MVFRRKFEKYYAVVLFLYIRVSKHYAHKPVFSKTPFWIQDCLFDFWTFINVHFLKNFFETQTPLLPFPLPLPLPGVTGN